MDGNNPQKNDRAQRTSFNDPGKKNSRGQKNVNNLNGQVVAAAENGNEKNQKGFNKLRRRNRNRTKFNKKSSGQIDRRNGNNNYSDTHNNSHGYQHEQHSQIGRPSATYDNAHMNRESDQGNSNGKGNNEVDTYYGDTSDAGVVHQNSQGIMPSYSSNLKDDIVKTINCEVNDSNVNPEPFGIHGFIKLNLIIDKNGKATVFQTSVKDASMQTDGSMNQSSSNTNDMPMVRSNNNVNNDSKQFNDQPIPINKSGDNEITQSYQSNTNNSRHPLQNNSDNDIIENCANSGNGLRLVNDKPNIQLTSSKPTASNTSEEGRSVPVMEILKWSNGRIVHIVDYLFIRNDEKEKTVNRESKNLKNKSEMKSQHQIRNDVKQPIIPLMSCDTRCPYQLGNKFNSNNTRNQSSKYHYNRSSDPIVSKSFTGNYPQKYEKYENIRDSASYLSISDLNEDQSWPTIQDSMSSKYSSKRKESRKFRKHSFSRSRKVCSQIPPFRKPNDADFQSSPFSELVDVPASNLYEEGLQNAPSSNYGKAEFINHPGGEPSNEVIEDTSARDVNEVGIQKDTIRNIGKRGFENPPFAEQCLTPERIVLPQNNVCDLPIESLSLGRENKDAPSCSAVDVSKSAYSETRTTDQHQSQENNDVNQSDDDSIGGFETWI